MVVMTGRGRGRLLIAHSAQDSPTENDVAPDTHRVHGGRISAGEVEAFWKLKNIVCEKEAA